MATDSGCATDLLVDLSEPESPKPSSPLPAHDDDYTLVLPKQGSPEVTAASTVIGDFSVSLIRHHSFQSQNDSSGESKKTSGTDSANEFRLLSDEEFDFDLPISPCGSDNETNVSVTCALKDDEEVFFGPVGHTEKCVAVAIEEVAKVSEQLRPLSPLTATQMAELCREACTVACQIEIAAGPKVPSSCNRETSPPVALDTESPCSPFNGLLQTLSSALPVVDSKLLKCDENGVVKFGAAGETNMPRPAVSHRSESGIAAPGLRRAPAMKGMSGLRPSALPNKRFPDKKVVKTSPNSETTKSVTTRTEVEAPGLKETDLKALAGAQSHDLYNKRLRSMERNESFDFSDNVSIASDTSESSTVNPSTGKRVLPQPKFTAKPNGTSKLAQFVASTKANVDPHRRTSSGSSCSSVVSTKSEAAVGSVAGSSPPLHRSDSLPAKDVTAQVPARAHRPGQSLLRMPSFGKVEGSMSLAKDKDQPTSSLRPPTAVPDMPSAVTALPGTDKRKMLTAMRSLQLTGSAVKLGPLKATALAIGQRDGNSVDDSQLPVTAKKSLVMTSTPSRQEPKRSVSNVETHTPRRNSLSTAGPPSSIQKRRSCLPSPCQLNNSVVGTNQRRNVDDPVSVATEDDSAVMLKHQQASIGLQKPSVLRTPMSKENLTRSMWSPAIRQKPFEHEEEIIQCTKRSALKTTN